MIDINGIKKLRQLKADLVREGQGIFAAAAGRNLTVAERKRDDEIAAALQETNSNIALVERNLDRIRSLGPEFPVHDAQAWPAGDPSLPGGKAAMPAGGKKYAELFGGAALNSGGFPSLEEFFRAVHSGLANPNLIRAASLGGGTESIPSDGGFFVPSQFVARLLDRSLENEVVRPRATIQPMTTETLRAPGWDDLDNSSGAPYGGFSFQWMAETASGVTVKPKCRSIQLTARKAAIFTAMSNELIADGGTSFESQLGEAIVSALGWGLDNSFLNGTGAGQPLGVLNDPALVTQTKETSQVAATLVYENVVKMFSRLHPSCLRNAVWVANPTTIPSLLSMALRIKNLAATDYVAAIPAPLMAESDGEFHLFTRPVVFTEKLPALGTKGDIILCDFSKYLIGMRREMSLEKSVHVGWQSDESGYRCIVRVDGQGKWNKPYTPKNGSTQSWVVCVETRS